MARFSTSLGSAKAVTAAQAATKRLEKETMVIQMPLVVEEEE
jgi:hypothetical protein